MHEYLTNIKIDTLSIIKILVTTAGFLALIAKLRESFNNQNKKLKIKTDLEILELSEKQGIKNEALRKKIEAQIEYQYNEEKYLYFEKGFFLFGLLLFVFFGFWAIDVIKDGSIFSWKIIIYLSISIGGFILMINGNMDRGVSEDMFFKIEFYNKPNQITNIFAIFLGVLTTVIFIKFQMTTWSIIAGLVSIWGLFAFAKHTNTKIKVKLHKKVCQRKLITNQLFQKAPQNWHLWLNLKRTAVMLIIFVFCGI